MGAGRAAALLAVRAAVAEAASDREVQMIVEIAYGRGTLPLHLPARAEVTIINKRPLPVLADPEAAVRGALAAPLGAAALNRLAAGRRSACILICDITRPVPNHLFLRPMIERMTAAGIPAANITVLVATGLHRPNQGAELAELVGDPWVLSAVRVENHFAREDSDHVTLGTTSRGTPVRLDRRFVQADLRIITGLVEPHFMAGYSGGRKVIVPGVAHADTIRTLHSARFMEDPLARQCNLAGNPLHEEQLEIVRMLGEVYGLDTVIDAERRLAHVSFGDILQSHAAAVALVRTGVEIPMPRRFGTIVTSAAGYPLDKTYYQTVKAMVTPIDILDSNGRIVVASECSEGFGSADFRAAHRRLVEMGPEAFVRMVSGKSMADIDEWQTEMQVKPMRNGHLSLYTTGLDEQERAMTGVDLVTRLEDAIAENIARTADPAVAVIPEGPYVVPFFAPAGPPNASPA